VASKANSQAYVEALAAQLPAPDAVAALVAAFENLVHAQAVRYWQPVVNGDLEDLEQVARMGMLEACRTFDATRGAFPTHAKWCIRHALFNYVRKLGSPVRLRDALMTKLSRLRRVQQQLESEQRRDPTMDELAARMGLLPADIEAMLAYDAGPVALNVNPNVSTWNSLSGGVASVWRDDLAGTTEGVDEVLIAMETAAAFSKPARQRKRGKK
jgi:DNA-directed RNA polymerase specialized sigma subunit